MTAPSMHPPLTEPATFIAASTIIAEPTPRGEDPQVSTTRARAKGRALASHSTRSFQISRISCSRLGLYHVPKAGEYTPGRGD